MKRGCGYELRKQSKLYPATSRYDMPRTVHLQTHHRGTTNRSDTEDCRAFIDAKVLLPHVTTRMEQSHLGSACLVLTRLKIRLEEIAGVAGQREIIEIIVRQIDIEIGSPPVIEARRVRGWPMDKVEAGRKARQRFEGAFSNREVLFLLTLLRVQLREGVGGPAASQVKAGKKILYALLEFELDRCEDTQMCRVALQRISRIDTAMDANIHEIPIINFARRLRHARRPVSSLCLLRQVSSLLSRNLGNQAKADVDEA